MFDVFGKIRPVLRGAAWFSVTGLTPVIAQSHMAFVPSERRGEVWDFYYRRWARAAIPIFGIHLTVVPSVIPPATGPRLVVANHRSPLDIAVLISLFGGHVLSRADVEFWPVLGRGAVAAGTIFVDRASKTSGAQAIRAIRNRLADKRTVIMFPEGGTFAGDDVRPFQRGAFVSARGLGVEVIPVGMAYPPGAEWFQESFGEHLTRVAEQKGMRVVVKIGEPIPQTGDAKIDAERAHAAVQALTTEARAIWDAAGIPA